MLLPTGDRSQAVPRACTHTHTDTNSWPLLGVWTLCLLQPSLATCQQTRNRAWPGNARWTLGPGARPQGAGWAWPGNPGPVFSGRASTSPPVPVTALPPPVMG